MGVEPTTFGLEVRRAFPLRHRDPTDAARLAADFAIDNEEHYIYGDELAVRLQAARETIFTTTKKPPKYLQKNSILIKIPE